MTAKPQLKLGSRFASGFVTVASFAVIVIVPLGASFPDLQGFPEGANTTASVDYSAFNLGFGSVGGGSMLVAFEIADLVLVVVLAGTVLLTRRGDTTGQMRTILTDGGRELRQTLFDDEEDDS